MRLYLAALTLTIGSVHANSQARARDLLGLHAGMTEGEAVAILSRHGKVERINAPGIGVTYFSNRYRVTICGNSNIVRDIDHYLGPGFLQFSKSVQSEEASSGSGKYRMFSGNKKRPFETIEIYWGSNPGEVYSVSFTSFGTSLRVSESLFKRCV